MTLEEVSEYKLMMHDDKLAVIEVYLDKKVVHLRYLNLFVTSQDRNAYFQPKVFDIDQFNKELEKQDCFLIKNNNKVYRHILEDLGIVFNDDEEDDKEDEDK